MAAKYGLPESTDPEGFDPYRDSVGAGIYSGSVKRNPTTGEVIIGKQYQNHNPRPGPVYDGGGYSLMAKAIQAGPDTVKRLLGDFPELASEVSTGGATPLHTCGMSRRGEQSTQTLIDAGADIEALDTYGYTPLHRMASNNLAIGFEALLKAGADIRRATEAPYPGSTPLLIAQQAHATAVLDVIRKFENSN